MQFVICVVVSFLWERLQQRVSSGSSPLFYPRPRHPTGTAKGCRGAAKDVVMFALKGHNTDIDKALRINLRLSIKLKVRTCSLGCTQENPFNLEHCTV